MRLCCTVCGAFKRLDPTTVGTGELPAIICCCPGSTPVDGSARFDEQQYYLTQEVTS